jgi:hypothetical protein
LSKIYDFRKIFKYTLSNSLPAMNFLTHLKQFFFGKKAIFSTPNRKRQAHVNMLLKLFFIKILKQIFHYLPNFFKVFTKYYLHYIDIKLVFSTKTVAVTSRQPTIFKELYYGTSYQNKRAISPSTASIGLVYTSTGRNNGETI